jgi:cell division protein FtsI (penicillin-binding protein 3)
MSSTWDQIKASWASRACTRAASSPPLPRRRIGRPCGGLHRHRDQGQEGIELAFQRELQGRNGTRGVVKDRLGRVVEDMGTHTQPADGSDIALSVDAKVQFFAYQRVREAVAEHKAKAGSVVVLDVQTGEILALANYPSYDPGAARQASPASSCATAR